jgi:hypothetical protein
MIALVIVETDREFSARWSPVAECGDGAEHGVVEIHIGKDVYEDAYADNPTDAQAWVDAFDFDELETSLLESDEPDDYDPYDEGDYLR